MHIMVTSTIFRIDIFVSAVQDSKAIFGPSFFNLKAILFTICEQAAMLSAILKPKSPENTTITYCRPTNHTVRKIHGTLTVACLQVDSNQLSLP